MKHSSSSSSTRSAAKRHARPVARIIGLGLVCAGLAASMGCETLQRKFTRKPKHPAARPTPIIHFEDYTKAMTPLDRYRKHYLIFEYWNGELIRAFREQPARAKKVRKTSSEALKELEILHRLLNDDVAVRFEQIFTERAQLDAQLQSGKYFPGEGGSIRRRLQAQMRQINREFYWRKVEDQLKHEYPSDAEGF